MGHNERIKELELTPKEEELYNLICNKIGFGGMWIIHKKHHHEFVVDLEKIRKEAQKEIYMELIEKFEILEQQGQPYDVVRELREVNLN